MRRLLRAPDRGGFSLLTLAILMVGLGVALVLILALLPNRSDQTRIDATIATIGDARDALVGFAVENSRLPVPDSDNDGFEGPAATFGALPYRDMGLPAPVVDEAAIPLRYAPYRNPLASADLAVGASLYTPNVPDGTSYGCSANPTSPTNLLDFCTALRHASTASKPVGSPDFVNTGPVGDNVAFALLSGGLEDADGNAADSSLDGPNDDGNVTYEDPARGRSFGYDDIVRVESFLALQRELSCTALVGSMDLLASTAQGSKSVADAADVQLAAANIQVVLDTIAEALRAVILADAIASALGGGITTTEICALAVACLGLCVNIDAACVAAAAAEVSAIAAAAVAAVDLVIGAVTLAVTIALRGDVQTMRDTARTHLCSAINEVHAADLRGGLL